MAKLKLNKSKAIIKKNQRVYPEDYNNNPPQIMLGDVGFPPVKSILARTLFRLFPVGQKISHTSLIGSAGSHGLSSGIETLKKTYQWPICNLDFDELIEGGLRVSKNRTQYYIYAAGISPDLMKPLGLFLGAVAAFEADRIKFLKPSKMKRRCLPQRLAVTSLQTGKALAREKKAKLVSNLAL